MTLFEEIQQNVNAVKTVKENIAGVVEETLGEGSLSETPFTSYPEKVREAIESVAGSGGGGGRKFTTGTVTFTEALAKQTVTHNLGVVPSLIFLYPKDFTVIPDNGTAEAKGTAWKWVFFKYALAEIEQTCNMQGNINTGALTWQCGGNASSSGGATETTFTTSASSAAYKYPAGIEFEWIVYE